MNFVEGRDDRLQPFRLGRRRLRGQHVRLGETANTVLRQTDYPPAVATLLGELMALTVVLGGSLKYDGVFSAQARGNGPVPTLLADLTSEGALRGYASFDRDALGEVGAAPEREPVPRLLGAGHLAFTVDQGPDTERYQGVVPLEGATLSACAHAYFRQSEQIATAVRLAAAPVRGAWRAGALMLQRVPGEGGIASEDDVAEGADWADDDPEEDWRRAVILMSSVNDRELLDPVLGSPRLLYRLFHEEGVRLTRPRELHFACRCSRERVAAVLRAMPREEVETFKVEDGRVIVTCQFCHRTESFDDAELDALYAA